MNSKTKALKKANELGEHATENEVKELDSKLPAMKKGIIAKVWDKVLFLWEQAKSPDVPLRLKMVIVGALLYLVLPLDVINDAIPGLGFVDDLSVILAVVREVSKYALPKIEKKLEHKVYELGYQKIDGQLSNIFKSFLITTIITFCANAIGCIILITKPFGTPASRYVSIAIFSCVFIYAVIRFIIYLKKYGKMTWKIAVPVFKNKSISKGLSEFICNEYKYLDYIFNGIQIAKAVVPELNEIPDAPKIIKTFEEHYKKRIILFAVIFALYTILITATKMILLRQ